MSYIEFVGLFDWISFKFEFDQIVGYPNKKRFCELLDIPESTLEKWLWTSRKVTYKMKMSCYIWYCEHGFYDSDDYCFIDSYFDNESVSYYDEDDVMDS